MADLIFGMMQSLDGYIAGPEGGPGLPMPSDALHWYWNRQVRQLSGIIYGRRMYEVMSYWDADQSGEPEVARDFADAWRKVPKWVASRTLTSVGPNAQLIAGDLGAAVAQLKRSTSGEIDVGGPELAASLTALGLIDEYRLYLMPVVLGGGKAFFGPGAPLDLAYVGSDVLPDDTMMVRYRRA